MPFATLETPVLATTPSHLDAADVDLHANHVSIDALGRFLAALRDAHVGQDEALAEKGIVDSLTAVAHERDLVLRVADFTPFPTPASGVLSPPPSALSSRARRHRRTPTRRPELARPRHPDSDSSRSRQHRHIPTRCRQRGRVGVGRARRAKGAARGRRERERQRACAQAG